MFDAARSQDREAETSFRASCDAIGSFRSSDHAERKEVRERAGRIVGALANAEPTNAEPTNAEPTNAEPTNAEPTNAEPTNAELTNEEPTNAEPTDAALDDANFDSDAAEEELATLSAHLDAATYRQLVLIRRLDESRHWAKAGAATCAAWLSYRIGMDLGTARDRLRVAHALATLPRVGDALRRGVVSYSKVRAIVRVATPANEEDLLEFAQYSTAAQLEKICRGVKQAQRLGEDGEPLDDAELARRAYESRDVTLRSRGDGTVQVVVTLLPDEAERVLSAVERMRDAMREESPARPPTHADAFVRLVDVGYADATARAAELTYGSPPGTNLDDEAASERPSRHDVSAETPSPDASRTRPADSRGDSRGDSRDDFRAVKRRKVSGGDTQRVVVQLAPHLLAAGLVTNLDDGTWVSAETWRRVACDCALNVVLTDDAGSPLDVGRQTRTIPPALGRALDVRDGGRCRFPGCHHRRFLDRHHIDHWANGGATKLDNLVTLCTFHHQLVHEGGWHVALEGNDAHFFRPDGTRLTWPLRSAVHFDGETTGSNALEAAQSSLAIGPETNRSRWNGKTPDYAACVAAVSV
ncbi:MAG: DUF222 domain-containing protein [Sandaracinus sp.]|nr:DUF222 domain-containing protein [Sandaracinus sp.]